MTDKVRLPSEPSPLRMRTLRQLDVAGRAEPGRPPGVASASGLIKLGDAFYVAPDDELSLVRIQGDAPGKKLRALPGTLPADPTERKKVKPDFEALCKLPSSERWPHGALLTLASGSGPNRQTSVVFGLNAKGEPQKTPNPIDMKPLVASLGEQFPDVNLEGAVRLGDRLRLFQRGNQGVGKNALIDLDLKSVMDAVTQGQPLDDSMVREVRPLELGEVNGVGLTLSDASPLDDGRVVFSAVAEDTQSSYTDGEFAGACLGILSADGNVEKLWSVPDHKIEGVHAEPTRGGGIRVWMVADADDPNAVSPLMTAHLPDPKTD